MTIHFENLSQEEKTEITDSFGKIIGMVKFSKCTQDLAEAKAMDPKYARKEKYYWLVSEAKAFHMFIPHQGNVRVHLIKSWETNRKIQGEMKLKQ